jgi:hypothetical protein
MKDLPHHMKKLNRQIIRSMRREETEELPEIPTLPDSKREKKKKAKQNLKASAKKRAASFKSVEERNQEMKKGRVPVFDRNNASPKHAKPSSKKTPRI